MYEAAREGKRKKLLTITHVSLLTPFPPFSFRNSNHQSTYSGAHPPPPRISVSPDASMCESAPPSMPCGRRSPQKACAVSMAGIEG
jgi:hypothetical protein